MRSRLPLLVLATVLALSFTACEDEPEPKIADPTSAPTTTASPPPTSSPPPTTPATSTPPKRESAKAFIRRWQQATVAMQESGDTAPYLSLTRKCRSCENLAKLVSEVYEDGGRIDLGEQVLKKVRLAGRLGRVRVFDFDLHSEPGVVRDASGAVKQRFRGGVEAFQVNLVPFEGSWLVTRASKVVDG